MIIVCPVCETEMEATVWEDGFCPECDNEFTWDEGYNNEDDDSYVDVVWMNYLD